jgi:hypothetical protein
MLKNDYLYYVDMLQSPTLIEEYMKKINVVNLKWGESSDAIRKQTFAKFGLGIHVFAQLAHYFVYL